MTSLQPTQAQCLGCIRKGATVTTSSMWTVKLLGSYLIATYEANIPIGYTDTDAGSYSSFPGHVGRGRKWPENKATAMMNCQ